MNDAHLRNNLSLGFVNVAWRNNVARSLPDIALSFPIVARGWQGESFRIGSLHSPIYIRPKRHIAVMVK